ncbi:MAG: PID-CTERM protein-sorting domain-containing protein [Chitinophagaceae bacterium]
MSIAQEPSFGDDVSDVPVDGGLSLLVAAGVGYGAKKLKEKRKQSLPK